jgi:lipopolysaccharide heptosyltransferase II/tetraacyldisaccharide 4'-kinase
MFTGEPNYLHFLRKYVKEPWSGSVPDWVLRALSAPYQAGARARRGLYQRGWLASTRLPAPVVSVGNLTVGGTGKTPVTAFLARLFQGQQRRVAILSRGYGGLRTEVTCLSDGERIYYQPPEVGDEAFGLARSLPGVIVYTGTCRYEAGMTAWREHRPDLFLLDDGFQHFQLARDLDIVLLDADRPFGNGRLLPAGPLREPLTTLRAADVLILTRYDKRHRDRLNLLRRLFPLQDTFTAVIEPASASRFPGGEEHPLKALSGLAVLAFAGLARPRVFQDALTKLGVDLRGFRAFPDHHAFTPGDLSDFLQEARSTGAQAIITTSKDWARLGQTWPGDLPLWVLKVAARVEPEAAWHQYLATALWGIFWSPASGIEQPRSSAGEAPQPVPPQVRRRFQKLARMGKGPVHPQDIRRILLRAPNWVGDAVMGLPVLTGLTHLFPGAQITVLAAPRVAPLYDNQPGVAEVIAYPAGREKWRTLLGLRNKFDLALALPNSFESALGLWLTRTTHRLGYAANGRSPLLTTALKGRKRLQGLHQVFYYLGLLEALGPVRSFSPPRLRLSEAERVEGKSFLMSAGLDPDRTWVGLAPGAAYGPAKRWPAERFAAVGDILQQELQAGLVLLGGPTDQEAANLVQRCGRGHFLNLAGKTTLSQALAVLSNLQVLITNDSGLMHVAAALGVPVVAIFGSTDPVATRPYTNRATIIHHPMPCGPCLERTCAQDYACLTEITVNEVATAARSWLEKI